MKTVRLTVEMFKSFFAESPVVSQGNVQHIYQLVGAQPPPCCSFARHLVGKMAIFFSFAHH